MKEQDRPLVSVVIPSYNHEQYVKEAIESVYNQTYPNIELVVIDDGSKDNSPQLLKELQEQYGFTLICRENRGVTATLNEAIYGHAKGKYIRVLASDDYLPENSVLDLVNYMEQYPEKQMVFGWGDIVDENNKIYDRWGNDKDESKLTFENLFVHDFILAPTAMFTRNVFLELGGYDINMPHEDADFWLRIFYKYPIGYFNDRSVAFHRVHNTNASGNYNKIKETRLLIFDKWQAILPKKTYNKLTNRCLFDHYRKNADKDKKDCIKLLTEYRFNYIDGFIIKSFIIGTGKLLFRRE